MMFLGVVFVFIFNVICSGCQGDDPTIGLTTPELIAYYGYPVTSHVIQTDDNYLLQYFRIPQGLQSTGGQRPATLLVHGLLSSSNQWFVQNVDKILPFVLAENGYDVWLANSRGTSYSSSLQGVTPLNTSYWQFSWEEMGEYDIPAAIDYILATTGETEISYIGHSMGTTEAFVMLSLRPEYNSKVRLLSALAPVAFMSDVRGITAALAPLATTATLINIFTDIGGGEVVASVLLQYYHMIAPAACEDPLVARGLCENLFFLIGGFDEAQMNIVRIPLHTLLQSRIPAINSWFPDITSIKSLVHYGQEIMSKKFARYDYGPVQNLFVYQTLKPPNFNLAKITAPVALYWSTNDYLSGTGNVNNLAAQLPNVVNFYQVGDDAFNHFDYISAIDAYSLVYEELIRVMNLYL